MIEASSAHVEPVVPPVPADYKDLGHFMIPSRYYLTILSLIPIVATQVWIMYRTHRMVQDRPDRLRLWRICVVLASVALFLGVLSEFGGD